MKKQLTQKLSLAKSTVADLSRSDQNEVKAGYDSATCPYPPICDTNHLCTISCPSVNFRYCK